MAIDKSDRFLEVLQSIESARRIHNITAQRFDLESGEFPEVRVHRIWCHWVLSFVRNPREVLEKATATLYPDGEIVLHEYFDYSTWCAAPHCAELDEFVAAVMSSWREAEGEPDIARRIPVWLEELGLEVKHVRSIVDIAGAKRADQIWRAFEVFEATPGARMITPGVLEIIARRINAS